MRRIKADPSKAWLLSIGIGDRVFLQRDNARYLEPIRIAGSSAAWLYVEHHGEVLQFARLTGRMPQAKERRNLSLHPFNRHVELIRATHHAQDSLRQALEAFPIGLLTKEETDNMLEDVHQLRDFLMMRHYACREEAYRDNA